MYYYNWLSSFVDRPVEGWGAGQYQHGHGQVRTRTTSELSMPDRTGYYSTSALFFQQGRWPNELLQKIGKLEISRIIDWNLNFCYFNQISGHFLIFVFSEGERQTMFCRHLLLLPNLKKLQWKVNKFKNIYFTPIALILPPRVQAWHQQIKWPRSKKNFDIKITFLTFLPLGRYKTLVFPGHLPRNYFKIYTLSKFYTYCS